MAIQWSTMQRNHNQYELDDDRSRVNLSCVHAWLASSYWSPNVSRDVVERAFKNSSLVIGAYLGDQQAGVLRVISDKATFAYIADVWVDEAHRKRGLAKAMLKFAMEHPEYQNL